MSRTSKVLIVATDGLTREDTGRGLETYGYEVLCARDGAEAVELLRSGLRISALVTEVELGGEIDGLSVAKTARDINAKINVIYTARIPHRIPENRKVSGAPCVRAPYHPHQIVGVLAQLQHRISGGEAAPRAA